VAVRVNLSEKMIAHKKTAFRRFFYALSEITWQQMQQMQQMQQVRQLQAQKQQLQPQVRRLVLVLVQQQELVLEQVLQLFSHRKRPEQQQQPELPKREICSYHYP
jgi:hypothetical protein